MCFIVFCISSSEYMISEKLCHYFIIGHLGCLNVGNFVVVLVDLVNPMSETDFQMQLAGSDIVSPYITVVNLYMLHLRDSKMFEACEIKMDLGI